ncbi:MAG: hypothetical protein ACK4WM_09640 [Thermoflexales bacterium]
MVTRRLTLWVLVGTFLLGALAGCGWLEGILDGRTKPASGWADVPMPPNLRLSEKSQLPLPVRLLLQALLQSSPQIGNVQLEDFELLVYESPGTPTQIAQFYTTARMSAAGWNMAGLGCVDSSMLDLGGDVAACLFGKQSGQTRMFLGVLATRDTSLNKSMVYYVRLQSAER